MPYPNSRKRAAAGLSLVELAIVMLIVGIMAAVAVPRFADSYMYYRTEAAAERVKADLELARAFATASSSAQTVSFLVDADCYSVTPGPKDFDRPSQAYTVDLSESPYQASLVSVDLGGDADVSFNGYGVADSGGTIVIQVGNYQQTISLDQGTGEASIPSPPTVPPVE